MTYAHVGFNLGELMKRRTFVLGLAASAVLPLPALAGPGPREHALRHGFKVGLRIDGEFVGFFKAGELGPKLHRITIKKGYILDQAASAWLEGDPDRPRKARLVDLENGERWLEGEVMPEGFRPAPKLEDVPEGATRVGEVSLTCKRGFGVGPVTFETGPIGLTPTPSP